MHNNFVFSSLDMRNNAVPLYYKTRGEIMFYDDFEMVIMTMTILAQ